MIGELSTGGTQFPSGIEGRGGHGRCGDNGQERTTRFFLYRVLFAEQVLGVEDGLSSDGC
jgi:hypothetical protein